jgi:glycosyltransferase involved in cell wall biosynthesis
LILAHEYPPYAFGGIGTFSYDLANALSRNGTNVTVMAGCPAGDLRRGLAAAHEAEKNLEVIRIPRVDLPPSHLWYDLMNLSRVESHVADFDVVHTQCGASFPMIWHCKRSHPKLLWVVTVHTGPISQLYYAMNSIVSKEGSIRDFSVNVVGFPLWDLAIRVHSRLGDAVVPVSQDLSEEIRDTYGVNPQKLFTINTGVNTGELGNIARMNVERRNETEKVRLFYAGRLFWHKGIMHLLKSLVQLNLKFGFGDYRLDVFGEGPLKRKMSSFISEFNLDRNVILRGFVPHSELIASMASSDIACVPSLYEACPVGMIEAMALGKPVVAFDRPFSRELFSGVLDVAMARNIQEYAVILHSLCTSQYMRTELGRRLQAQAVARFDVDKMAEKYLGVYNGLLS